MNRNNQSGLIVRQKVPLNLEFQFSDLNEWNVPVVQFYVRNHFSAPDIDAATWRLRIGGAVETPMEFSLEDLQALPETRMAATMECAGNGRVYYEPAKEGLQWQNGAVGNASWTGVMLRQVLEMAGIKSSAVEVVLIGGDKGVVDGGKKTASPGPIAFARSLPLSKALHDGTLLAYGMNDAPLEAEHGFPLRAVVGGWFGMAWVKWLTDIRVVERPFLGYWQTRDYFRWERELGEPTMVALAEMEVKAQIARPVNGSTVPLGKPVRIFGAAWSGEAPIAAVEVSIAGQTDWQPATLLAPEEGYAWRFWEYYWTPPTPGRYTLLCRAIDTRGNLQPATQQADRESYVANWTVPIEIRVVEAAQANADEFMI
ncbi:MAG: sulfite oxidase [Chthonomonadaceae bacterium]|nr:sulfite oxidase [Chthonomonadaceae bacterium]